MTLAPKVSGDLVYVLGATANEMGASEYYELLDQTGLHVPQVNFDSFKVIYRALEKAIANGLTASVHAVARGGLATHGALVALGGGLGFEMDLARLPVDERNGVPGTDALLFSESAGRFIVTVAPENKTIFEKMFKGMACAMVGRVTDTHTRLVIKGTDGKTVSDLSLDELETAWKAPLGDMI